MENITKVLLQIPFWIQQWKNFKNLPTFGEGLNESRFLLTLRLKKTSTLLLNILAENQPIVIILDTHNPEKIPYMKAYEFSISPEKCYYTTL